MHDAHDVWMKWRSWASLFLGVFGWIIDSTHQLKTPTKHSVLLLVESGPGPCCLLCVTEGNFSYLTLSLDLFLFFFHYCSLSLLCTFKKATHTQVGKGLYCPQGLDLTFLRKLSTTQFYQALTTWLKSQILMSKQQTYLVFQTEMLCYWKHKLDPI